MSRRRAAVTDTSPASRAEVAPGFVRYRVSIGGHEVASGWSRLVPYDVDDEEILDGVRDSHRRPVPSRAPFDTGYPSP